MENILYIKQYLYRQYGNTSSPSIAALLSPCTHYLHVRTVYVALTTAVKTGPNNVSLEWSTEHVRGEGEEPTEEGGNRGAGPLEAGWQGLGYFIVGSYILCKGGVVSDTTYTWAQNFPLLSSPEIQLLSQACLHVAILLNLEPSLSLVFF